MMRELRNAPIRIGGPRGGSHRDGSETRGSLSWSGDSDRLILGKEERVEIFRDDDQGYRKRLVENPNGFVLNVGTHHLHRASCHHVDITTNAAGKRWTSGSAKSCATQVVHLTTAGTRPPNRCRSCSP